MQPPRPLSSTFSIVHVCALIMMMLALPVLGQAQAANQKNSRKVLSFLEKKAPDLLTYLEKIEGEEGKRAHKKALKNIAFAFREHQEILELDGPETADLFFEQFRIDLQMEILAQKHFHAEGKAKEQARLRRELLAKAKELHQLEIKALEYERDEIKDFLLDVENQIAAQKRLTDDDLNQHVDAVLGTAGQVGPQDPRLKAYQDKLPEGWMTDLDAARAESREANKPLLVYASAVWCPPCHTMLDETLTTPAAIDALKHVVPVCIESDLHHDFMRKHSVGAVPSLLILNPKGSEIGRKVGIVSEEVLVRWLDRHKNTAQIQTLRQ